LFTRAASFLKHARKGRVKFAPSFLECLRSSGALQVGHAVGSWDMW